jgi:NADPH2:quinone reductase
LKAIICRRFAPVGELEIGELPDPVCGPEDVLFAVHAAGVNFFDGLIVEGKYQTKPPFPFSPGGEVAGVVRAVGSAVGEFAVGDRVAAFCGHGGYAEQVAVPQNRVFPMPAGADFVAAAGFLVTYGTSWHALADRARLRAGETLLVLGAAGGVGLAAVELGKLAGARVIAAASSTAKLALARQYGADEGIDYTSENLRDRVRELTGGNGVDVVYDPVGGNRAPEALRALAWQGRYLVVGFAAGDIPKFPANLLLLKSADLLGVLWGASLKADPVHHRRRIGELLGWLAEGKLRPHVSRITPLTQSLEALSHVMAGEARGKVVLTVEQPA